MTFSKFKQIAEECYIDDNTNPHLEQTLRHTHEEYDLTNIPENPDQLVIGVQIDGVYNILFFWVNPKHRNKGVGTYILDQLPKPHCMVVDYRSETMQALLKKLGYSCSDTYELPDGTKVKLCGGDHFYYKGKEEKLKDAA